MEASMPRCPACNEIHIPRSGKGKRIEWRTEEGEVVHPTIDELLDKNSNTQYQMIFICSCGEEF